jgi:hypothetical protein
MMGFRIGEGLPLDQMYVESKIIEEERKKKGKEMGANRFYSEDYYYAVKNKWEREEPLKKIDPGQIMDMDRGLVCILGLSRAGKKILCKYFCWKTLLLFART